jgi:toxin YoeB
MGKYKIEFRKEAEKDLILHKKSGNKANINKIQKILIELFEHPYSGEGQPEALKHELSGFWSRRINQKDRIIYKIEEQIVTVLVVSATGHYE